MTWAHGHDGITGYARMIRFIYEFCIISTLILVIVSILVPEGVLFDP